MFPNMREMIEHGEYVRQKKEKEEQEKRENQLASKSTPAEVRNKPLQKNRRTQLPFVRQPNQEQAREIRTNRVVQPLTVRTTADGSKQIGGYAIIFNSKSTDLGGFKEICDPLMLNRTLRESPDVLALRDHKSELLLGRTTARTLELKVDSKGLAFTITLPKTTVGDDAAENVRLGNLTGCSFGFSTVADDWNVLADGSVVRTLLDINLFEISITSFPAYSATTVNTRTCPGELRSKLSISKEQKRDDKEDTCNPDSPNYDPDNSDCPDADEEDRCDCQCEECEAGNCDECSDAECTEDDCLACPAQSRAAHLALLQRRLRA